MAKIIELKRCCTVCDAKKVCHVCGDQTLFACSDCQINLKATVYVCGKIACRTTHDEVCSATAAAFTMKQIEHQVGDALKAFDLELHVDPSGNYSVVHNRIGF